MNRYSFSFQPDGKYFVFNVETGKTVVRDLLTAKIAREYMFFNGLKF